MIEDLKIPITYNYGSVLCQSEYACLHPTANMVHVVSFFKNNENTYPKGRALIQMCRVILQTKSWNFNAAQWSNK